MPCIRPPLIRTSLPGEPAGLAEVAVPEMSPVRRNMLSGSRSICGRFSTMSELTTSPICASCVRSSGASPVTETLSVIDPTSSTKSRVILPSTSSVRPLRDKDLKPLATTSTSYLPGGTWTMMKSPVSVVTALNFWPVSTFSAVTAAWATRPPVASKTVPAKVPVVVWASIVARPPNKMMRYVNLTNLRTHDSFPRRPSSRCTRCV